MQNNTTPFKSSELLLNWRAKITNQSKKNTNILRIGIVPGSRFPTQQKPDPIPPDSEQIFQNPPTQSRLESRPIPVGIGRDPGVPAKPSPSLTSGLQSNQNRIFFL